MIRASILRLLLHCAPAAREPRHAALHKDKAQLITKFGLERPGKCDPVTLRGTVHAAITCE